MKNHGRIAKTSCRKFFLRLYIPTEDTKSLIDRCHHGGNKKYYKDIKKTRPIYPAMLHWKTCEQLILNAREKRNILIGYKWCLVVFLAG